jgi:hypothetical protein
MRLTALVFAAVLIATNARGQTVAPARPAQPSPDQDAASASAAHFDLPVSVDRIRRALERPPLLSLGRLDERPTFRVQILERRRIDELLATLDFRTTQASGGGIYWNEIQRLAWPSVDNPLVQPYAAFSSGELITLAVENLAGKFVGEKLKSAVTGASRTRAQTEAREEVLQAIQDYCAAQPEKGAGIQICSTAAAIR